MDEVVVLYTTWPDIETAEAAGAEAVAQGLCACVNLMQPIRSIHRWKGAVEQAAEIPMLCKTTRAAAPALRDALLARHPYETACVLALPVAADGSNPDFLAWIAAGAPGPDGSG